MLDVLFCFCLPEVSLCDLQCQTIKNNHRNSTVASTSHLRLHFFCLKSSSHASIHLCVRSFHNGKTCGNRTYHVFCWHITICTAAMCKACWARLCTQVWLKLTGWLFESFGRVDNYMQKAIQSRSLLIWKTDRVKIWWHAHLCLSWT